MVMTAAVLILLCSIFGIVYACTQIKDDNRARLIVMIICSLLALVSAGFIFISLYFAWAVRMN